MRWILLATLLLAQADQEGVIAAAPPHPTARVTFLLELRAGAAKPETGELRLIPVSPHGQEATILPLSGRQPLALDLPEGSTWELQLEAGGFWSPRESFSVAKPARAETRALPIWPTGRLAATVRFEPKPENPPAGIELTLIPPPGPPSRKRIPKATLSCPVGDKGELRCEIPSGALDLALRHGGYVPHYRWGLEVPAGGELPLGPVTLRAGSSLAGWAVPLEGALEAGKGRVRLRPLQAPGADTVAAARLREAAAEGRMRDDGFFQLGGLEPGWYGLEAEHPGYATARLQPVEVVAGGETTLREAIVLHRPLELSLEVIPRTDPAARPWRIEILRAADFSTGFEERPVFAGPVDGEGRLRAPGQAPGAFWLRVDDSAGNRLVSDHSWIVRNPEDGVRRIEINMIIVSGEVKLGDEPLSATLWFGGRFGSPRVIFETGEDGRLFGQLPRAGKWLVELLAHEPEVRTHTTVEVKPDKRGRASLEIVIPDTLLFGRVVDAEGRPAPDAAVMISDQVDSLQIRTDDRGAFEVRALPPGLTALAATRGEAVTLQSSERTLMALAEGQSVGPIELRLRPTRRVLGTVSSRLGPVPGAVVAAQPVESRYPLGASTRAGLAGAFLLELPAGVETAAFIVSAPGAALQGYQIQLTDSPIELPVSDAGGLLEVQLPLSDDDLRERGLRLSVFQNQVQLPISTLHQWARGNGETFLLTSSSFRVPRLAPGDYRVCLVPKAGPVEEGDLSTSAKATCAAGFLPAHGTLHLEVSDAPKR